MTKDIRVKIYRGTFALSSYHLPVIEPPQVTENGRPRVNHDSIAKKYRFPENKQQMSTIHLSSHSNVLLYNRQLALRDCT